MDSSSLIRPAGVWKAMWAMNSGMLSDIGSAAERPDRMTRLKAWAMGLARAVMGEK